MVSQCTKFEVSRFTHYEAMNYEWRCKMQKMGWFGAVKGHSGSWQSKSSAMSPFDRAHTTSYSTLIETMHLSYNRLTVICQKSPILTHPTCIQRPRYLWHQKTRLSGLSCGVVCVILRLAVLEELRLVTDRQTQTDRHRPMASTGDAQHRAIKRKVSSLE